MTMLPLMFIFAHAEPTTAEILAAVDKNMTHETRSSELKMTVEGKRRIKEYEMQSYSRGKGETALLFLSPPREKGTKMLKRDDSLWMYLPSVEKTQKISGHMLRQGMMGSDLSYEDLLQSTTLTELYEAKMLGQEEQNGRLCYRIELTATDESIAYPKRISWVDVEHLVPVKEDLYAISDILLKTWTMSDVEQIEGRMFPTKIVVEDKLQQSSVTTLEFVTVQFSVELEEEVFSQRWLER